MRIQHFVPLLLVASLTAPAQERAPAQPPPVAAPAPSPAPAAPNGAQPQRSPLSDLPTVALEPLLQRVGRAANKKFLIGYAPTQIYLAGADANEITYPLLLSILRANSMAVVEIEGRLNVVSETVVRNYPVPFANTDDPNIAADEWRTRVLPITNVEAAQLVPILRPLLPQAAHLAAFPPSNQLVIVDRYANLKRITEIVRALDKPPPR